MDDTTTPRLIAACVEGDELAIEQLIRQYQTGVFRFALSVLNDPVEANEAAQDAFIAALGALKSYQDRSSFKAWLYTITLNVSRSKLRKQKTLQRLKNNLAMVFRIQGQKAASLEDAIIQNEKDAALWIALSNIDEKHRIPLVLRYYHEMPIAEIAQVLNISEGTVHSRLFVGRDRLRKALEKQSGMVGE